MKKIILFLFVSVILISAVIAPDEYSDNSPFDSKNNNPKYIGNIIENRPENIKDLTYDQIRAYGIDRLNNEQIDKVDSNVISSMDKSDAEKYFEKNKIDSSRTLNQNEYALYKKLNEGKVKFDEDIGKNLGSLNFGKDRIESADGKSNIQFGDGTNPSASNIGFKEGHLTLGNGYELKEGTAIIRSDGDYELPKGTVISLLGNNPESFTVNEGKVSLNPDDDSWEISSSELNYMNDPGFNFDIESRRETISFYTQSERCTGSEDCSAVDPISNELVLNGDGIYLTGHLESYSDWSLMPGEKKADGVSYFIEEKEGGFEYKYADEEINPMYGSGKGIDDLTVYNIADNNEGIVLSQYGAAQYCPNEGGLPTGAFIYDAGNTITGYAEKNLAEKYVNCVDNVLNLFSKKKENTPLDPKLSILDQLNEAEAASKSPSKFETVKNTIIDLKESASEKLKNVFSIAAEAASNNYKESYDSVLNTRAAEIAIKLSNTDQTSSDDINKKATEFCSKAGCNPATFAKQISKFIVPK
jgi:hypothetical protein